MTGNHHRHGSAKTTRLPELSKTFALLSRSRQELFRPVLENPRAYVLLSARGLARRLKVDPATAVRVATKLGFRSYREFQEYLHELVWIAERVRHSSFLQEVDRDVVLA